jgi:hypothetical protein
MDKTRNGAVRQAVRRSLDRVTKLETVTAYYVARGRADARGEELTRSQFLALYAEEANLLREELRTILSAIVHEQ